MESAVPILPSRDLRETLAFYERLGFENAGAPPEKWNYLIVRRGGIELHFYGDPDVDPLTTAAGCYLRVTDADPCYFCAMLASRGPVYDEDSFDDSNPRFFGPGDYKVHDHCNCTLEPLYYSDAKAAGRAEEFEALWRTSGATKSGREAIREFRRAYEGRLTNS